MQTLIMFDTLTNNHKNSYQITEKIDKFVNRKK